MPHRDPIEGDLPAPPDVAAAYDRWSHQYDDDRNTTRDLDAQVVRRAPLRLAGRDVLELGCGTGKNTEWLAAHARQVVALDFSAGMLAAARRRIRTANVRFVQHDVREPWPLDASAMDVVVGNLVLEHVRDLTPIYSESARVLRSGGQLLLCELHPFRQLRGGQAHFMDRSTGETVHVPAFPHSASDYVNAGLAAGL
ncbi:MAG TPA: class I SAM-dependent methyltransferase, partial [Candidatus Elarobacter sp.]|nr:class I SAM-dependent methyltransferase [Candidatus Elarobacter sp.]